jgi:mannose-6-phosphate isomerase-like protein (cupin superfamily)
VKISIDDSLQTLPLPATQAWPQGVWDIEAFKHGSMSLILFAPKGKDYQTRHDQDELYFVMKGKGILIKNDIPYPFSTGDALFVAAGVDHHFENFTDDITLWAVFWGPKGGERS